MSRTASAADQHIAARIRIRRRALGMSQERLAERLGVTFQQVQKYERAANRVAAGTLFQIAQALDCPVEWFFAGLTDDAPPAEPEADPAYRMINATGGLELSRLYLGMDPEFRASLLSVAKVMGSARALGEALRKAG